MANAADRSLPTPSGDDGTVDPRVEAALADLAPGDAPTPRLVAALACSRLLVPVVAVLDEAGGREAHRTDRASHLASVSTTGRDGRRGQLAFTSLETMRLWDPAARPVPVATRGVAAAALADGADAVVLDLAGPIVVALEGPVLRALAAGWEPVDDEGGTTRWGVHVALAGTPEQHERRDGQRPGAVRRTWWRRAQDRR